MNPTRHLALALLTGALGAAARADSPCVAEADRFCAGKAPAELLSCLQAHRPDLAPACVDRLERALVFFQDAAIACEVDAYEFCKAVAPGMPMVDCLRAKQGKLTPRCQQFFDQIRAREDTLQRACAKDLPRVCPGVSPGRGELPMCLLLKGKDLSPGCQAAL